MGSYPSWPKGVVLKTSRRLVAVRGFKSLTPRHIAQLCHCAISQEEKLNESPSWGKFAIPALYAPVSPKGEGNGFLPRQSGFDS